MSDLSESQRLCLRLVAEGYTSKEIAKRTNLSPSTVDQYLHRATAVLGASSRRDAARKLAELEAAAELKELELKPEAVAEPAGMDIFEPSGRRWRQWVVTILPPLGGRENDLTFSRKLIDTFRIAFVAAVTALAIALVIKGAFAAFG